MDTKVISTRISQDFSERVNRVADRLYPKSYTGQPNRTQLIMDALKLFCDLGEAGSLDGINLSQVDTKQLVYIVNNPKEDILKSMQKSLLRIEEKLDKKTVYSVNKKSKLNITHSNKDNATTYSVDKKSKSNSTNLANEIDIFSLQSAWEIAKAKGFSSNKESFRKRFDRRSDNPNFILYGFKRISKPKGKGYLYQLQKSELELND